MNYWKAVERNAQLIPLILTTMFVSYKLSIYLGWREPVEDITIYIPTYLGGIFAYIFLVPYVNHYISPKSNM